MARLIAGLSLLFLFASVSQLRADALSVADLQQLFTQGNYDAVVKGATEALAPGSGAPATDHYAIASLKAEALLNLRQADAAIEAFNAAAKETEDKRLSATATATAMLIAKSPDFIYTSRAPKPVPRNPPRMGTPPKPVPVKPTPPKHVATTSTTTRPTSQPVVLQPGEFDIIPQKGRLAALTSFWNDERADAEKSIKEKLAATPPAVSDAVALIRQNTPLATATGNPDWAVSEQDQLVGHFRLAVLASLKTAADQLDELARNQHKRKPKGSGKPMPQNERDVLNHLTDSLQKTDSTLKDVTQTLALPADTFSAQHKKIDALTDRATTILAQN